MRLSPAYDIVPTVLYAPEDRLALPFVGTRSFEGVTLRRFTRVARFLGLDPAWIEREVRRNVSHAVETWPALVSELLDEDRARQMLARLETLALVQEVSRP